MTDQIPPAEPTALPRYTTPTWEMELLVSGATVFGLLQLPALVDRLLFGLYNTGPAAVSGLVLPMWVYLKFALIVLIATFVLHLCLRGYWVAVVGLASVYPQGIRWDRLRERTGPFTFADSQRRFGDLAAAIEGADNRASKVFGVGFGMASMMLIPIAMVGSLMAVLWIVERVFGPDLRLLLGALGLFVLMTAPYGLFVAWDRRRGASAAADGLESRLMRLGLRFYYSIGLGRAANLPMMLFSTNEGRRRSALLLAGVMTVVFGLTYVDAVADRMGWSLGDYAGLPANTRAGERVLLPIHYASQRRDTLQLVPVPVIPDPLVRGPYLRLFVPYFPQRDSTAMRARCPQALAEGSDAAAKLACLAALHAVAIDGQPVAIVFDAAEDPQTGQRGMLAMIPVGALAEGRHELTVMPAARARDLKPGAEPLTPWRIPFWR